jgi:Cu2+-exporting ATPase
LLQLIASLNQYSEHPLAQAVVNFAETKKYRFTRSQNFEAITGKGLLEPLMVKKSAGK